MSLQRLPLLEEGHPRYEQVKALGSGAWGKVFLCKDKSTGELVAVKFIERDQISNYVESEILNHRRLSHPHVVQFKEVFLTQRCVGIAMEYVAGCDLFRYALELQPQRRLAEGWARYLFQQFIVALDYCHRKGVANRDIKLENTLLDSSCPPQVKLCDFGYAKHAVLESAPKSLVGTPAYLAPEVVRCFDHKGATYDGPPADVWSAGVMLYTMLTGSYPFERVEDKASKKPVLAMYERIKNADYYVPAHLKLSPDCVHLLSRILVPDPNARITIQGIYQHPWFLAGLPAGALTMNDTLERQPPPDHLQSEAEIKQIIQAARMLPSGAAAAGGVGAMDKFDVDELMQGVEAYNSCDVDVLLGAGLSHSSKGGSLVAAGAGQAM